ncbi:MAG TPA: polysaccharide biosynthesis tyrosine autokinase, partial [Afifellaceae bacterium]|nr:polysaccharide biosynthesis tyrosine autokinase [Afifellaceae bacterium]
QLLDLLRRYRLLFTLIILACVTAGLALALSMPQRYVASALVLVEGRPQRVIDIAPVLDTGPPNPLAIEADMASEREIILSKKVLFPVFNALGIAADPDYAPKEPGLLARLLPMNPTPADPALEQARIYERFAKNVDAMNVGPSRAIEITYQAESRARAVEVVNAIAERYATLSADERAQASEKALQALLERVDGLRTDVAAAEAAVERYRAQENLSTRSGADISEQRMIDLNTRLVAAQGQVSNVAAQLRAARGAGTDSDAAAAVLASPVVQQLRVQEATLEARAADLATTLGPAHPGRARTAAALAETRANLAAETRKIIIQLESQLAAAQAEEAAVRNLIAEVEGEVAAKDTAEVRLRELTREAEAKRSLYEQFLSRIEEVSQQIGLQTSYASVISPAFTARRSLDQVIPVLGAMVIGTVLAFGAVLLRAAMARGYESFSDLEPAIAARLLAMLPAVGRRALGPSFNQTREANAYLEAVQGLRAFFRSNEPQPSVIMFASSVPEEGKTTGALTFARLSAFAGQKVLLLEADLRRPRLGSMLGSSGPGLSEVLGDGVAWREAVRTEKDSGLDIIMAGTPAESFPHLLESGEIEALLSEFRRIYDLVVIDTPPVLAVADARVLAPLADFVIFLVRWSSTPRRSARLGLELLGKATSAPIGVVLSHVTRRPEAQYGYQRAYSAAGRPRPAARAHARA